MGMYINTYEGEFLPKKDKVLFLQNKGGVIIDKPLTLQTNLVCIIDWIEYDAAAYAFNYEEFRRLSNDDFGQCVWMIVPNADLYSEYVE
jgi:hypothetical protein